MCYGQHLHMPIEQAKVRCNGCRVWLAPSAPRTVVTVDRTGDSIVYCRLCVEKMGS